MPDNSPSTLDRDAQLRTPATAKQKPQLLHTLPIFLAGTLSLGAAAHPAVEATTPEPENEHDTDGLEPLREHSAFLRAPIINTAPEQEDREALSAPTVPASHTVQRGETVSSIAARYGLSTKSVLDLNGLGWSTLIFPGQKLILTKQSTPPTNTGGTAPAGNTSGGTQNTQYRVVAGDTVSKIAARHGVSTQAVLDANRLGWSSLIFPGQTLTIPTAAAQPQQPAPSNGGGTAPSGSDITPIDPAPVTPTVCATVSYTVNPGDTVSKIAAKFGVTTQSVLTANNLSWSSLIFSGQKLTVPNANIVTDDCQVLAQLTAEQRANAQIIVNVGKAAGVPEFGIVIALATAAQESGLRNINYGDRDSVGLFQQRPSQGWGTVQQILDQNHAARAFFGGHVNPNPGKTIGLLNITGWQNMTLTQAAQAVQRSATPNAFAKWEESARAWYNELK